MNVGRFIGCHQRPDRSFFYKNKQLPVCARCTGVFIGEIIAIFLFIFKIKLHFIICLVFFGIMFGDWLIQQLKILQSTNTRRLITGLLGGYGYMTIVCEIILWIINFFI